MCIVLFFFPSLFLNFFHHFFSFLLLLVSSSLHFSFLPPVLPSTFFHSFLYLSHFFHCSLSFFSSLLCYLLHSFHHSYPRPFFIHSSFLLLIISSCFLLRFSFIFCPSNYLSFSLIHLLFWFYASFSNFLHSPFVQFCIFFITPSFSFFPSSFHFSFFLCSLVI